jgi:DNA-binding transcriptional regulator GbsR (MarR family)
MAHVMQLSTGKLQFIEEMGRYFEQYGVARIGGRVFGLLMLAEQPLSLDEMAAALGVARSSISTNVRVSESAGMVERVTFPGDRRDYYRWTANTWERSLRSMVERTAAARRVGERGMASLEPDDDVARARLEELLDYCDFAAAEMQVTLARWRERRAGEGRARETSLEASGRKS